MFNKQERNMIIMALMYLQNDYTEDDLIDLRMRPDTFDPMVQALIEDLVGPTWDEEQTAENIKRETAKRSRYD